MDRYGGRRLAGKSTELVNQKANAWHRRDAQAGFGDRKPIRFQEAIGRHQAHRIKVDEVSRPIQPQRPLNQLADIVRRIIVEGERSRLDQERTEETEGRGRREVVQVRSQTLNRQGDQENVPPTRSNPTSLAHEHGP